MIVGEETRKAVNFLHAILNGFFFLCMVNCYSDALLLVVTQYTSSSSKCADLCYWCSLLLLTVNMSALKWGFVQKGRY